MEIVLFRHAHKGVMPLADPELSDLGFDQARRLGECVRSHQIVRPTHAWCSEKIRTQQTLAIVCEQNQVEIENSQLLNVRSYSESADQFRERIKKFLDLLGSLSQTANSETQVHFVCTHYDWIEESMVFIPCDKDLTTYEFSSWAPGQYLHFEIKNRNWNLLGKGVVK